MCCVQDVPPARDTEVNMDWLAWIPVIVTVLGAAYTWYRSTRILPHEIEQTKAETAKLITDAAGEVVEQLQRRVDRLEAEIVELQKANAQLKRENTNLRKRIVELERENELMRTKTGDDNN